LYCERGGFYIDPWRPVDRAIVTHGHSDHARWGMKSYLTAQDGAEVVRLRVGREASIDGVRYGERVSINGVIVSLHPAGHILGSAQVRIEHAGEVWVISGDYKTAPDSTCVPFEPIRCHVFVSETTFGLPVYRWRPEAELFQSINAWWAENRAAGRTSVILCYALGKSQRVLSGLDASIGPILFHGAMEQLTEVYRRHGIALPLARRVTTELARETQGAAMVLAPPSAQGTPWLRKLGEKSVAMASGWMQIRGMRRRRAVDQGFVISDHADWPGLVGTIEATGAEEVWLTHGYADVMARYLAERGWRTNAISTYFEGEAADSLDSEGAEDQAVAESELP
jgi:putative mRNA 3-end processing factor